MNAKSACKNLVFLLLRLYNNMIKKEKLNVFFYPHENCRLDGYDILNGDSDNVLCLFNDMIRDPKFNDYHFYIIYYCDDRLLDYQNYCMNFRPQRIHFINYRNRGGIYKAICRCFTIFTDTDYTRIYYKSSKQRSICLNYFGGLIKNEFHRWTNHGGFKKMLQEQRDMYRLYDYHLSISDVCSKFIALDNCHYYPHFLSLGFPRNDVLFKDHSALRKQIEEIVGFSFKRIITYVPTHRDYENPEREFFDKSKTSKRSIWGDVTEEELESLEETLAETETLIIAKVHPIQHSQTNVVNERSSRHILFYKDLVQKISTSLNPLLAISDSIITDYTTTVFDYLYMDRPIIYYFYDIDRYRQTRGFFIEPIESICAGQMAFNLGDLQKAIRNIANGQDPEMEKRNFLRQLFIKDIDANATQRIKNFFFPAV